jgi:putative flippase GtrA
LAGVVKADHSKRTEGNHLSESIGEFARSLVKYGLIGILTVGVQAGIFLLLAELFRLSGLVSYVLAVITSLVVAYFGQSRWTFAARKSRSVTKYGVVVLISFALGSVGTWVIVDWAGLSPFFALPLMVFVIPFLSFLMLRAWVFR